eukprot:825398-Prymnesium_polylepis.1
MLNAFWSAPANARRRFAFARYVRTLISLHAWAQHSHPWSTDRTMQEDQPADPQLFAQTLPPPQQHWTVSDHQTCARLIEKHVQTT